MFNAAKWDKNEGNYHCIQNFVIQGVQSMNAAHVNFKSLPKVNNF